MLNCWENREERCTGSALLPAAVIVRTHSLPALRACDSWRQARQGPSQPHPPAAGNNTSTIFSGAGNVLQQLPSSTDLLPVRPALPCTCLLHSPKVWISARCHMTAGFLLPGVNAALHVDTGSICIHYSVTKSMPKSWGARRQGKPASIPIAGFFFGEPEALTRQKYTLMTSKQMVTNGTCFCIYMGWHLGHRQNSGNLQRAERHGPIGSGWASGYLPGQCNSPSCGAR